LRHKDFTDSSSSSTTLIQRAEDFTDADNPDDVARRLMIARTKYCKRLDQTKTKML